MILSVGAVPLKLLEEIVKEWLSQEAAHVAAVAKASVLHYSVPIITLFTVTVISMLS